MQSSYITCWGTYSTAEFISEIWNPVCMYIHGHLDQIGNNKHYVGKNAVVPISLHKLLTLSIATSAESVRSRLSHLITYVQPCSICMTSELWIPVWWRLIAECFTRPKEKQTFISQLLRTYPYSCQHAAKLELHVKFLELIDFQVCIQGDVSGDYLLLTMISYELIVGVLGYIHDNNIKNKWTLTRNPHYHLCQTANEQIDINQR